MVAAGTSKSSGPYRNQNPTTSLTPTGFFLRKYPTRTRSSCKAGTSRACATSAGHLGLCATDLNRVTLVAHVAHEPTHTLAHRAHAVSDGARHDAHAWRPHIARDQNAKTLKFAQVYKMCSLHWEINIKATFNCAVLTWQLDTFCFSANNTPHRTASTGSPGSQNADPPSTVEYK